MEVKIDRRECLKKYGAIATVAAVVGGSAAVGEYSNLVKNLYNAFVPKPVHAEETTDVLEIPYDTIPIPEFKTQPAETIPSFYDEDRWKDVPGVKWNYLTKRVDVELPVSYWRHDDKWLEILLDVPAFTEKKFRKNFVCFFFDTLSSRDDSTGAPGFYAFQVYFTPEGRLVFGNLMSRIYGNLLKPEDYRYRWSFGQTANSAQEHITYDMLFDKRKLTEHSDTMFLSAYTNDLYNFYGLHTKGEADKTIRFSKTFVVPELPNPGSALAIALSLFTAGYALIQKQKNKSKI